MCRTRTNICDSVFAQTDHTSTCYAKYSYIQRCDISSVTAYYRIINSRTSVLDNTDVRSCSTYFEINTIGCTKVHQRSHYRSCRTGKHGKHRTFLHFIDLHNTTVTTHDHKRNFYSCTTYRLFCLICCVEHLGKNTCVDRCCSCSSGQSIQFGDVRSDTCFHSHLTFCYIVDFFLSTHIIYTECFRCYENLCTLCFQFLCCTLNSIVIQIFFFDKCIADLNLSS